MHQSHTAPNTQDRIIDDVFLTPRVLDESAFTGYAESLRTLIRDADERSTRLKATSTDTEKLCRTILEAARQLQLRTAKGEQIASTLGEHTIKAETLIDRLASTISSDAELERLADQVIRQRRAAFEKRVADSVEDLFARYSDAERRAEDAEKRARDAEHAIKAASDRAAALESRVAGLTERISASITDAEKAVSDLTSSLDSAISKACQEQDRLEKLTRDSISRIKQAGAAASDQAEHDIDALRRRSAHTIEQTESCADRAVTKALEAIEQLRVLAQSIADSADTDAAALERRLSPFKNLLDRAQSLLGDEDHPGELTATVQRAELMRTALDSVSVVEDIDRAERATADLRSTLETTARHLDSLDSRRAEICEKLEQEIEALGGDLSPIERAAAGLRLRLDQLEQRGLALAESIAQATPNVDTEAQANHLRAAVDEIISAALQRTEEAGMWLVKLIQRAEQLEGGSGTQRD